MKHGLSNNDQSAIPSGNWLKRTVKLLLIGAASVLVILLLFIVSLRWINPPATSFTLQEDWSAIQEKPYSLRSYWVSSDELPDNLMHAVIASEDQLFYEHNGFDWESIREAYEDRIDGTRERGASTISQQVVKNLFLWPAASFIRKGIEAGLTVLIELFWSKERIINIYLNIAEFGPGIYGVGKASQVYFNQHASELTAEQSSRLAAVLPSPKRMRVNPPSPYTLERSRWILNQMTMMTGYRYLPQPSSQPDSIVDSPGEDLSVTPDSLSINSDTLFTYPDSLVIE